MAGAPSRPLTVYVDRGGTFTDVVARIQGPGPERLRVLKLLSVDPAYADAPTEGIRRILEQETGVAQPRGVPLDTSRLAEIRMGTTVATNALLERAGERCALAVSAGFRDVLHIGTQSRPRIFDLEVVCPDVLYDSVVEVDELVSLPLGEGGSARDGPADGPRPELEGARCVGTTGEEVVIRKPVDVAAVTRDLQAVFDSGIRSLAVCLKHAALYPGHEHEVGAIAKSIGFTHVSLSSVVLPAVKMVPRGYTAMADAYLTPHIQRYLAAFTAGFDAGLSDGSVRLSFMQSDGGLARAAAFSGHRAILSGPAGGVVGFARTTRWGGGGGTDGDPAHMQVVGFDMGGTSTDVSRVARGVLEHVFESTTAGITIAAPQLDVNTVAAGGGSKLTFSNGALCVGPDSVGAHPGPVCYHKGGSLAVTDANLQLGRIVPAFFPRIFGKDEDQPLDGEATGAAFLAMADAVNAHQRALGDTHAMSVDEVAAGFVRVANEAMCRPIRALTNMRGFDPSAHVLACFGGAGGQHCCAIARALGMRTVFVHRFASVLSALGIGLAATVHEEREPAAQQLAPGPAGGAVFDARFSALEQAATGSLAAQGFPPDSISCERYLNLRYAGTDVAIMTPCPSADGDMSVAPGDYAAAFMARYKREFGFSLDRPLIVDDLRVRATAAGAASPDEAADTHGAVQPSNSALPEPSAWTSSFFEGAGRVRTPVFTLAALPRGSVVPGPALLVDDISTVVVEPGCSAHITAEGNIRIQVEATPVVGAHSSPDAPEGAPPDPIQLSVFGHRFMGIAEQMGRTLQRTSVSVNIKERLDFSCALFGPDGGLVANAPHLPVHLGAMQEAVRFQLQHHAQAGVAPLVDGDVLVSNHPQLAGGSHLPDITVITPVFDTTPGGGGRLVFFVASRGHHADIGGISPGSMPPNSTSLAQEGAAIVSFKLVKEGVFQEEGISELLNAPASSSVPGCCGTRNLSDNLSDLRAQVAANQRGIALVRELIAEHSLRTVQAYMTHIRRAAEQAVRAMLVRFSLAQGLREVGTVRAVDYLDDGTPIHLAVTIDRATGSAVFDFSGTGPQVHGNLNAPPAVTYSAVIYALRCMVREEIPLNQGCLAPITLTIPDGSVLRPSATAAVVGGNVLTSQRVTDVVLRAFDAAAASQGCMNNLTFGDAALGYYETICGGAGAGPGFHGRSGVHTHMTNTRITDPEILERRYPVVLRAFRLRPHSGGAGAWSGGDGVVRELEVLRPLTVGILSERRALPPFGLHGGGDGQRGTNMWLQAQLPPGGAIPADVAAREVSLGGKATVLMQPGDRLRVLTPGGGGYGQPGKQQHSRAGAQPVFMPKLGGGSLDAFRRAQESL